MENRTREQSYFYLCYPCRSQHTCGSWIETGPPWGLGAHRRCFLALMVDALVSTTLSPPRDPSSTFLTVDDVRSWIPIFGTFQGGGHRRRFLSLMVDALGSPALAPPGGPPLTFFSIDGGRSRISSSDSSQGATVDVS
jgi:hypothetical protein